LGLPRVASN